MVQTLLKPQHRTADDAKVYLELAEDIMGEDWISPKTFRFGASGLLGSLLAYLNGDEKANNNAGY